MSPGKSMTRKRKSQARSHNKKTGIPWLVAVWIFENACTDGICLCRHFGSFHIIAAVLCGMREHV